MSVEHIEVIVEEPSMEMALRTLLPRMVGSTSFEIYPHQGKDDLLARLPERLLGYARWIPDTWRIVVIVDRDDADCAELKGHLEKAASAANLTTRSRAGQAVCSREPYRYRRARGLVFRRLGGRPRLVSSCARDDSLKGEISRLRRNRRRHVGGLRAGAPTSGLLRARSREDRGR